MKFNVPYLTCINKRYYWLPRGRIGNATDKSSYALGKDITTAISQAQKLYDDAVNNVNKIDAVKSESFQTLANTWIASNNVAESTLETRRSVMKFWSTKLAKQNIANITKIEIKNCVKNDPAGTGSKKISILRSFLNWCEEAGFVNNNVAKGIRLPKSPSIPKPINDKDLLTLVKTAEDLKLYGIADAIILSVNTGLRCGDIILLKWTDIIDDCINLTQQKTSKDLSLPITNQLHARINIIKNRNHPCDFIINNNGSPYCKNQFRYHFRKIRIIANLPSLNIHDIRDTFAQKLADRGVNDDVISAALGQSSTQCLSRYRNRPHNFAHKYILDANNG